MSPKVKRPQHEDIRRALSIILAEPEWTQARIAELCDVHRQAVHAWVHDDVEPSYGFGKKLVDLAAQIERGRRRSKREE